MSNSPSWTGSTADLNHRTHIASLEARPKEVTECYNCGHPTIYGTLMGKAYCSACWDGLRDKWRED